jgi:hypothetical protein
MKRRHRRHPAAWLVLAVVLILLPAIVRGVTLVALAALVVWLIWRAERRPARRPAAQRDHMAWPDDATATVAAADPGLLAELDQARAEAADLRGQLAAAQDSAMAAWDQSASRTPRRLIGDTRPLDVLAAEQLAAQPMSGARRIGGQQ